MNISSFAAHSLPVTRNDYSPNQICQPPFAKLIGNFSRTSCGRPLRRERAAALFIPFLWSSSFSFCPLLAFVNGVLLVGRWGCEMCSSSYKCPLFSRDNRVLVYTSSSVWTRIRGLYGIPVTREFTGFCRGSQLGPSLLFLQTCRKETSGGGRSGPLAWSDQVSGVTALSVRWTLTRLNSEDRN